MEKRNNHEVFLSQVSLNEDFLQIFDFVPDVAFYLKDKKSRFMFINQKGSEVCGQANPLDVIGKTDHDFFDKSKADKYRKDDLTVFEKGEKILGRMEAAANQVGSERLIMTDKIPIRNKSGKIIGLAGLGRQVDQFKNETGSVDLFTKTVEYIQQNFQRKITVIKLAKMSAMSLSQFERRFRGAFGVSVGKYVTQLRISGSINLLIKSDLTIAEVAHSSGFYDQAHYCRAFKSTMKVTPSAYRKTFLPKLDSPEKS